MDSLKVEETGDESKKIGEIQAAREVEGAYFLTVVKNQPITIVSATNVDSITSVLSLNMTSNMDFQNAPWRRLIAISVLKQMQNAVLDV